MELIGKIINKLPVQSGVSARGNWSKQEFILETQDSFPKKICMNVWGVDKVDELGRFNIGENLKVSVNIESREFNNRWYTDVRAWKIERMDAQAASQDTASSSLSDASDFPAEAGEDDLPF
ncbi:MAG: hypothetical protein CVT93_02880 [Bacteroidetes bacterium HGW-Bacteroidetes-10]|nr:MAG: hypothetical protein CVT93_02880 [Bacteroidetes bacterium HGW-Bacteroidetes-10]